MQRWRGALLLAWTLCAALQCQGACVLDSSEAIRALPYSINQNNGQDVTTILTQPCKGAARGISVLVPGSTSWTITSRDAGALDLRWAKDTLVGGQRVALENVNVSQAVLRASPLGLCAFNASSLKVIGSSIETDCHSLSVFKGRLSPENGFWVSGPTYLYVANYTTSSLQMDTTNLTCGAKTVTRSQNGSAAVDATDGVSLLNALVWSQEADRSGPFEIRIPTNISWDTSWWAEQFTVVKNVTISAPDRGLTVLDFQGATSAITIASGAYLTLNNFALMNVGPLRGTIANLGMLPLFAVPIWFFNFTRNPFNPQLITHNVTVTLPGKEYDYFIFWTLVVTTQVSSLSDVAEQLKATTPIVELSESKAPDRIVYKQLRGSGGDGYNFTITNVQPGPPTPFNVTVQNTFVPDFSIDVAPNITQLAAYDLSDFMAILSQLQSKPEPGIATAVFLLRNLTIDPAVWPAGGYTISTPLVLVGQTNTGTLTWLDFQRVPRFLTTIGEGGYGMYVYFQGLVLLNLPNALLLPPGSQVGSMPPGSQPTAASTGVDDATVFFSGIAANATTYSSMVYLNQTAVVITYAEFKRIRQTMSMFLPPTVVPPAPGRTVLLGASILFNVSRVLPDVVDYLNMNGWGWRGYKLNLTHVPPPNTTLLYRNVYDPPFPPLIGPPGTNSGLPTAPPGGSGGSGGLLGWQVALIVIACVVFVGVVAGVISWSVVRKLRKEVEAVKSGSSDKDKEKRSVHSGNGVHGSGSNEGCSGPGENGSRGVLNGGGSGGELANNQGTPKALAGGGGGARPSDDSSMAADKPPLEVLNAMMNALTNEMEDQHLTILEVIGQGGFGVVYKGMWKGLVVAVKTITFQDRVVGGEKGQHRAILEAAISSSLAHPNVVTTYSYDIKPMTVQGTSSGDSPRNGGVAGGGGGGGLKITDKRTVLDWKLYLIQEYCDGGSLRSAVLKRKFFDPKRGEPRMEMILDTCIELIGGLVHLHDRNIIHGDLNPNNVLLKRDMNKKYGATCKIADFGLSIKMNADQSHISNMRRGTPFYTCPQILARGNMTKAADVYSFGVMMWEMYHSCMSYRNLPNNGFAAREAFPHFPRRAPYEFARLVGSCLDPEPAQRPTFPQLRSALVQQLSILHQQGHLQTGADVLGPDPSGDAALLAACQD